MILILGTGAAAVVVSSLHLRPTLEQWLTGGRCPRRGALVRIFAILCYQSFRMGMGELFKGRRGMFKIEIVKKPIKKAYLGPKRRR